MQQTEFEIVLLIVAILLLTSIFASKVSARLGVPALLLFLMLGMLAGSEGIGGITFDDPRLAQSLGIIALVLIIFSGGLESNWVEMRPLLVPGALLSSLGVITTALLLGIFAAVVLKLSWAHGLLLGAIVSSTDAAAVFSVLRSKGISLKGSLRSLLELESGSNDPMAVFLTTGVIGLLFTQTVTVWQLIPTLLLQVALGLSLGFLLGKGAVLLLNRLRLEYTGLYPVLTLSLILLTYSVTSITGGNGFLAVYVAGLTMGHHPFVQKRSLVRFYSAMAWLMQIVMFLILGLLVFPSELLSISGTGLLVAGFLMLVARPISVLVLLAPFGGFALPSKGLVSWVGLRGAVPIILATFPMLENIPQARTLFNLVFFVVLLSALLQGTSIAFVAKLLGVDQPTDERQVNPLEMEITKEPMEGDLVELEIAPNSFLAGRVVVEAGFPMETLIVLIMRNDRYIIPHGQTLIMTGDMLLMMAKPDLIPHLREMASGTEDGFQRR